MANGKVCHMTLCTLGSSYTTMDESAWALLTDRVKALLHGAEHALLSVDDHIEAEARRFSALVMKNTVKRSVIQHPQNHAMRTSIFPLLTPLI